MVKSGEKKRLKRRIRRDTEGIQHSNYCENLQQDTHSGKPFCAESLVWYQLAKQDDPWSTTCNHSSLNESFAVTSHKIDVDWGLPELYHKAVTITSGLVVTGRIQCFRMIFLNVTHPSVPLKC